MSDNEAPIVNFFLIFLMVIVVSLIMIGIANIPEAKNELSPIVFYLTPVSGNETYPVNITEPYYMIFDYPKLSEIEYWQIQ